MANKAYKFRLYPTKEQEQLLIKTFGCVRFVYNKMLAERKDMYERLKHDKEGWKQPKFPTPAKYKEEFPWLKEVDSLALANAQLHLQQAFQNFFDGRANFPKFKKPQRQTVVYHQCRQRKYQAPRWLYPAAELKWVKMKQHRNIPSHHRIKSCTISRTKTGKYFVSILTEYEHQPVQKEVQAVVGLDFSMNGLFVDSEGKKANYPRFYHQALERLAKAQRILSRRQKGSKRWHKQRLKVAKLHEKIANQRKDFLHKASRQLANEFDCVFIEDLNMKGMSQALRFGKSVTDHAWGCSRLFFATS
jgi:putative transposase